MNEWIDSGPGPKVQRCIIEIEVNSSNGIEINLRATGNQTHNVADSLTHRKVSKRVSTESLGEEPQGDLTK